MDLGIKGKRALITGGSHGIGRATALVLAREGCDVAICARNKDRVDAVVGEIRALGVSALGFSLDATVLADVEHLFSEIGAIWGSVDILVNNVGGGGRWGSPIVEETAESVWVEVWNKNALAAIRFTMRAIPLMRRKKWGRVVTIASRYGKEAGGRPWFTMAKSAEISLMKTLALNPDLIRDGITFNTVAPGGIMIPDTGWEDERKKDPDAFSRMLDRDFPLGRMGTPEEVADVVAFACSAGASLMNGALIAVDGGESKSF